jgi:hypothetical protein
MVIGVLVWWLSEVWYQNKDKTSELEAEPSSLSVTFLTFCNLPQDPGSQDPNVLRTLQYTPRVDEIMPDKPWSGINEEK